MHAAERRCCVAKRACCGVQAHSGLQRRTDRYQGRSVRCLRDLAVGCNGRVWSGIRRLATPAALPQARFTRVERLSGDSLLFPRGAALGPIPRASVPSPAYLMWPVPPGVSVGATDTTVLGFFILGLRELFRVCLAQSEQQIGTTSRPELHISRSLYYRIREGPLALPFVCLAPASQYFN